MNKNNQCELAQNNLSTNEPCAFCHERTEPLIPYAIFKKDTRCPICDKCTQEHVPELYETMSSINEHIIYLQYQEQKALKRIHHIGLLIQRVLPLFELNRTSQAKIELTEILEIISGERTFNGETNETPF